METALSLSNASPLVGRCAYYITNKGRFCNFQVLAGGASFCFLHKNEQKDQNLSSTTPSPSRICCPFDPHHTIYQHDMFRHLPRCTFTRDAAVQSLLPFRTHLPDDDDASPINGSGDSPDDPPSLTSRRVELAFQHCVQFLGVSPSYFLQGKHQQDREEQQEEEKEKHNTGSTVITKPSSTESVIHNIYKQQLLSHHTCTSSTHCTTTPYQTFPTTTTTTTTTTKSTTSPVLTATFFNNIGGIQHLLGNSDHHISVLMRSAELAANGALKERLDKHDVQCAAVVARLLHGQGAGPILARPNILVVEFGAGKAGLTRWIAMAFKAQDQILRTAFCPTTRYVLLEMASRRNAKENKNQLLTKELNETLHVVRLRMDIQHFDLPALLAYAARGTAQCLRDDHCEDSDAFAPQEMAEVGGATVCPPSPAGFDLGGAGQCMECCGRPLPPLLSLLEARGVYILPRPTCANAREVLTKLSQRKESLEGKFEALFTGRPVDDIICVAKHACGSATDYTLRCAVSAILPTRTRPDPCPKAAPSFWEPRAGEIGRTQRLTLIASPCCHHRCSWKSFAGREFLGAALGITEGEFPLLCAMTGWATNADRASVNFQSDRSLREIGVMAKRILDTARVWWLREQGGLPGAQLVRLVDFSVTPENVAIVANSASS